MKKTLVSAIWLLTVPLGLAHADPQYAATKTPSANEAYTPGLGDIMGPIQMRHAKLWFAGANKNWALAAYELDEIKEGFGDAARFQSDFKGRPVAKMVEEIIEPKLAVVEKAIEAKNQQQFARAFNQLTKACNACHQSVGYGFISIQSPTQPPYSNQRFKVE